ncbi:hypothetical protein DH2020_041164 [Rehmannia glutinosa]|uniref:Retrovirus-related Pol polyprotein from transposon TNT 1-94-like beta-barrel domain-containing protein n=1 Tax=Rehmannia glutinosa TaxID=99300 RepID=A0ABR0UT34_REHGL
MSTRINNFDRRNAGRGVMTGGRGPRTCDWNTGRGRGVYRRTKEEKEKLVCKHCTMTGHEISECFKLHGYPDWFKKLREDRNALANSVTGDFGGCEPQKDTHQLDIATLIKQEISKALAGRVQQGQNSSEQSMNFTQYTDFAGTILPLLNHHALTTLESLDKDSWILDTGASKHMCASPSLMQNLVPISSPVSDCLPDGTTKVVTHSGQVAISSGLLLHDVLLVPSFKYNLLSIAQLTQQSHLKCSFFPSHCLIQDLRTEEVKAMGKAVGLQPLRTLLLLYLILLIHSIEVLGSLILPHGFLILSLIQPPPLLP